MGAHTVTSDQALAEFRMRVAQLRKQRWQQIEYSEDPPQALLFMPNDARDTFRGGNAGRRSGGRATGWWAVTIDEAGKVISKEVEPPATDEPAEATEAETAEKSKAPS